MNVEARVGHFRTAISMVRHLVNHRQLTWAMAKQEISDRYAGQVFGRIWAFLHPILLMGLYVFIFGYVLKLKVGGTRELPLDFTTYLLAGLIPWVAFQEAMGKGVAAITGNSNLVKQVVFPLEVLPLKGIIAALITQLIASAFLLIYVLFTYGYIPWTYTLLPVLWFFQFLAMGGVCFILAAIAPYFRDAKDIVQVFTTAGMYLMPTFYLPSWVPAALRPVLYANPFSYMIWCYQDACYFGRFEHPWAWIVFGMGSTLLFYVGYRMFARLKASFGSVL